MTTLKNTCLIIDEMKENTYITSLKLYATEKKLDQAMNANRQCPLYTYSQLKVKKKKFAMYSQLKLKSSICKYPVKSYRTELISWLNGLIMYN